MYNNSNGLRLRDLRLLYGLTQKAFADSLGTPQSYLSQVERGLKPADSLISRAMFTFAPPSGFFDAPASPYASGSLNFRTGKVSARVMDAASTTFAELERASRDALQGKPYIDIARDDLSDRSEPFGIEQINVIADETRALLKISPEGPVLNVTRAAERAGIPVIYLHNPYVDISEIDGISSPEISTDRGVIAIRPDTDGARTRFTRAHELGHLVLHTHIRPGIEKVREQEAHRFAGAFLMPAKDAYEQISPTMTLEGFARVKSKYAISIAALIRRALELNIITPERYRSLNIQISSRGWKKVEPVTVPVETPLLLKDFQLFRQQPPKNSQISKEYEGKTATVIQLFNKDNQ